MREEALPRFADLGNDLIDAEADDLVTLVQEQAGREATKIPPATTVATEARPTTPTIASSPGADARMR